MLNYLITILIAGTITLGGFLMGNTNDLYNAGDVPDKSFGATSYPTSLDNFTNPSATDSVKTVSHSQQHANANDAIEALQAKLGISASTATNGSLLFGNGTGSSIWSASPSITGLTLSGQGIFGSFISQGSSTISGLLNFPYSSSTAYSSFVSASSTNYYGAGLTSCTGGSFLTWNNGFFGCGVDSTGSSSSGNATSTRTAGTTSEISTTTSLTAGQRILIWGSATGQCDTAVRQFYMSIRPPSGASTTIDYKLTDSSYCSTSDIAFPISLQGSWMATTSGTYKIFLHDNSGSGVWRTSSDGNASTSIMYIIQ